MLDRLFPRQIDNNYRGWRLAIWILVLLVLFKLAMSLNSLFNTRFVMEAADAISLASFGEGESMAVFLFRAWALGLFLLCLLSIVTLIRYRAMIPFAYVLLTIEQLGRQAIQYVEPARAATSGEHSGGYWVNQGLSAALVIGLVLSLLLRSNEKGRD